MRYPEDLPDQEILEVFAAVGVPREQQGRPGCRECKHRPDERLLNIWPAALRPSEEERRRQRRQ